MIKYIIGPNLQKSKHESKLMGQNETAGTRTKIIRIVFKNFFQWQMMNGKLDCVISVMN